MLIDKVIIIKADGKLDIEICLKAAFQGHYDIYDDFMSLVDRSLEMRAIADWHTHQPGEVLHSATVTN
jgi:hypothetical protein